MSSAKTLKTFKKRYPNQWLLLTGVRTDQEQRVTEGVLVAHSKDRAEIYRRCQGLKEHSAIEYSGTAPKDLVVILPLS